MTNRIDAGFKLESREHIDAFLASYLAPLRISAVADNGFPLICSLWFEYADGALWCATKKQAKIVEVLEKNPKCAFELAPNEPPYFGVRGQAEASIHQENAGALLERLIDKYLGTRDSSLALNLLKRVADEVAIRIDPVSVYSWDYRSRMQA